MISFSRLLGSEEACSRCVDMIFAAIFSFFVHIYVVLGKSTSGTFGYFLGPKVPRNTQKYLLTNTSINIGVMGKGTLKMLVVLLRSYVAVPVVPT